DVTEGDCLVVEERTTRTRRSLHKPFTTRARTAARSGLGRTFGAATASTIPVRALRACTRIAARLAAALPSASRLRPRTPAYACRRALRAAPAGLVVAGLFAAASPTAAASTLLPPPEITRLLEAEPLPRLSQDPRRRYLILLHEHRLLPTAHLDEPAVSVVGYKVNPRTYGRHAPLAYYGLTLVDLATGSERPLSVPSGAVLGYPFWSADGQRFAFTATVDAGIELWVGNPADGSVRRLVGPELNGALSAPCTFMPDSRRVLCRLIDGEKRRFPAAPSAHDLFRLTGPATMQSLSQQALDPWMVRQLIESQLTLIDTETGLRQKVGAPAAVEAAEPAPSGAFLLVSRIVPPYPQVSGGDGARWGERRGGEGGR